MTQNLKATHRCVYKHKDVIEIMDFLLTSTHKLRFSTEFRNRLETLSDLPGLPETAQALILLRNDPDADIASLVSVIEQDPAIAMQLIAYARSAVFGYGDRIKTVNDSLSIVLGFHKGMHMALGLSAGRSLKMTDEGPLGREKFWSHSVLTAALMERLAQNLPSDSKVDPGLAYLAGLFHDIGFLLLGHLYPYEFSVLNELVAKYPDIETRELELLCLGVSHDMTGMWLMRAWNLPEELVVGVGEHYFPDFDGHHSTYSKLVNMANQMMKLDRSKSNALTELERASNFSELGLSEDMVNDTLDFVHRQESALEEMAQAMAA